MEAAGLFHRLWVSFVGLFCRPLLRLAPNEMLRANSSGIIYIYIYIYARTRASFSRDGSRRSEREREREKERERFISKLLKANRLSPRVVPFCLCNRA